MKTHFLFLISLIVTATYGACPDGFVEVPPNDFYEVSKPFCVMVYPAKAKDKKTGKLFSSGCEAEKCGDSDWAKGKAVQAVSAKEGVPWRNVTFNVAKKACEDLGEGYGLINNKEWMTIANDLEGVGENWTGGKVGEGSLIKGHSDGSPDEPCDNTTENVGEACDKKGGDPAERRVFKLSNGNTLWDFSGNLWEWVDWEITFGRAASPAQAWVEFDKIRPKIETGYEIDVKWFRSAKNPKLDSKKGIGMFWSGIPKGKSVATRSSRWNNKENSGIYTLDLSTSPERVSPNLTFRCVKR